MPLVRSQGKIVFSRAKTGSKPGLQYHTCVLQTCHFAETMSSFVENRDVTAHGDGRWHFICGPRCCIPLILYIFPCEASVIHNSVTLRMFY